MMGSLGHLSMFSYLSVLHAAVKGLLFPSLEGDSTESRAQCPQYCLKAREGRMLQPEAILPGRSRRGCNILAETFLEQINSSQHVRDL